VLIGAEIVGALQSIVARNVDPMKTAVVSVCMFNSGTAFNIIPRSRPLAERRAPSILPSAIWWSAASAKSPIGIARAYGGSAETTYTRKYPATINHAHETEIAVEVARDVVGADRVNGPHHADHGWRGFFIHAAAERPGAFILLGMGDGHECHHPSYVFNDSILGPGASYWVRLIEKTMPAQ
jgi:hippurate hydrolase